MAEIWFTDDARVDVSSMVIKYNNGDTKMILGSYERRLVDFLYQNKNEDLSKDEMIKYVWGEYAANKVDDNQLAQRVRAVRILLRDENGIFIKTVHGYGYKYVPPQDKPLPKDEDTYADTVSVETAVKNDNVYISTKKEIESMGGEFSFLNRCLNAGRIISVCYAGTSFLAHTMISGIYDEETCKTYRSLLNNIRMDLVLVSPESSQMKDMINYKLRPRTSAAEVDRTNPFQLNCTELVGIMEWIKKGREAKLLGTVDLNVYFADFAMPNSYFQCCDFPEESRSKETIKVDMYIPLFSSYKVDKNGMYYIPEDEPADDNRPSFIITREKQPEMYSDLSKNILDIIDHSEPVIAKGEYIGDWKRKLLDYSNGEFERPFDVKDIHENLI